MPELREHAPTLRVDGVRDSPPSGDLLVGIHSRRSEPSAARNRNRGCLGDDKTAFRSALRIVLKHQFTGDITWLSRSRTCEGRHHDAMTQSYRPNCYRREKPSMYSHVFLSRICTLGSNIPGRARLSSAPVLSLLGLPSTRTTSLVISIKRLLGIKVDMPPVRLSNMQGQCRSLSVEAQCFMGFGQAHVSAFAENSARESRSRRPSTSRQPCAMHNVASTKRAIAAQDGPVILGRTLRPRCGDYRSGNAPKAL